MDLKRVLICDERFQCMVETLRAARLIVDLGGALSQQELLEVIHKYDVLIVGSDTPVTRQVVEAGTRLKVVARAGVGVDNLNIDAASDHGIIVINAPTANTSSTCELACAKILSISRNLYQANKMLKNGIWRRKDIVGIEIAGKTLGVIGLGRIGLGVCARMRAFGMNIIGHGPTTPGDKLTPLGIEPVSLEEIWRRSDYISLHVPLSPSTRYLLNRDTLAKCKDGVMIINCSRGGIIEENHLLEALDSGKVRAAALDVFENEPTINQDLVRHPGVSVTPHMGGGTLEAFRKVSQEIVDQLFMLIKGEQVHGALNAKRLMPHRVGTIRRTEELCNGNGISEGNKHPHRNGISHGFGYSRELTV